MAKPALYPEPYTLTPLDILLGRSPWTLIYGCQCDPDVTCKMHADG